MLPLPVAAASMLPCLATMVQKALRVRQAAISPTAIASIAESDGACPPGASAAGAISAASTAIGT